MTWPIKNIMDLLARRNVSHRQVLRISEVGSTIHGISLPNTDDLDLTVIRIEDWHELINGPPKRQSMMIRTQPEGVRSRFGDIDLQVYTLRKFAGLAVRGNPSILTALFSPETKDYCPAIDWERLIRIIPSQSAGQAFLGYMRQQLERWQGRRGQKNVNRPELVAAHGYDTKYAGHVIRLGYQGNEYMRTARMVLPLPTEIADIILRIRRGKMLETDALDLAQSLEVDLKTELESSEFPEHPATAACGYWLSEHYAQQLIR